MRTTTNRHSTNASTQLARGTGTRATSWRNSVGAAGSPAVEASTPGVIPRAAANPLMQAAEAAAVTPGAVHAAADPAARRAAAEAAARVDLRAVRRRLRQSRTLVGVHPSPF